MNVVVVGQAPSSTSESEPFSGRCGARISALMGFGCVAEARSAGVLFVNIFEQYPGRRSSGRGDAFSLVKARARVIAMIPELAGAHVVLVGRNVALAFGIPRRRAYFQHTCVCGSGAVLGMVYVSPHPSGLNRWWNSDEHRAEAAEFGRMLRLWLCA